MKPYSPEELDVLLEALSHHHRRQIILRLEEADKDTIKFEFKPPKEQQQVDWHIRLYHHHVPKLESAGLIKWNKQNATLTVGDRFDRAVTLLEAIHEEYDEREF
ncbi:DUF7344 domain-containing protein [Halobacteriaceae archaeon SHR40]|uniref:DUF7344 domain-containing protein n=1 Tax=Halovenus amylolytica TaxID=2500550 RepID=UPI000FE33F56